MIQVFFIIHFSNVTYRYSLLNQNDGVSYDDELENALTKAGLYHDSSDDDEVCKFIINLENVKKYIFHPWNK